MSEAIQCLRWDAWEFHLPAETQEGAATCFMAILTNHIIDVFEYFVCLEAPGWYFSRLMIVQTYNCP